MTYSVTLEQLHIKSGDILCTTSEGQNINPGQFWRLLGRLLPGTVDHVAIYLGPAGLCIESAIHGVVTFEVKGNHWIANQMFEQRGHLIDNLYGVAYPLAGRGFNLEQEELIRSKVRNYCLAQVGKPYNLNFLNPDTENTFYCSQLAYKAYLPFGINLNTGLGIPDIPGSSSIIFPQEIWCGCENSLARYSDII
jgi:hypothetical protein